MNTQILFQVLSEISGRVVFINFYGAKFVNAVLVSGVQQSESWCRRSSPLLVRHCPRGSAQRWRARPVLCAASHPLSVFCELFSGFRRCPLFVTLWTVARQDPLSLGFLGRILEWVVKPSSMGIFPTQGSNPCLLRLLHWRQILSIVYIPESQSPSSSHPALLPPPLSVHTCIFYLCVWAYLRQSYCLSSQRPPYLLKSECRAEYPCFHAVL